MHRPSPAHHAIAVVVWSSFVAVACGGGGGGSAQVTAPLQIALPATIRGDVAVTVTLTHAVATTVDVVAEVSRNGGATFVPARVSGSSGLATGPLGVQHTLAWDSLRDAGFRGNPDVVLRLCTVENGQRSPWTTAPVPVADNQPVKARAVQFPFLHYGPVDATALQYARQHDLIVLHPVSGQIDVATVRALQQGVDPDDPADDPLVLAYLSIGEDLRTIGVSAQAMLLDPRFVGDGSGPRVDPRGPDADGQSLLGLEPRGNPSPGGTGYASFYLDDNSVDNDPAELGDGVPDRNSNFGGCFVNAGDPTWYEVLAAMTQDGPDGMAGIHELLQTDFGRGYGYDGLFLDTVDTCAPNSFTDGNGGNQSEFEWTAAGFAAFMGRLKQQHPDKVVLQNRGLFFYDPRHPHYRVNPRTPVDFVLFESYRLNSNAFEEFDPYFFPDNKHNIAPKLMAEANRPDGFTVLSLGYAAGPGLAVGTLRGESTAGLATLVTDLVEAQDLAGFKHYLTDAGVAYANAFVRERSGEPDTTPPVWSSTDNDHANPWPQPAGAPTPRVGVQQVEAGACCATVRFDVALDRSRVGYALYLSSTGFDFTGDPGLAQATRIVLEPTIGAGYPGLQGCPHEAVVTGLTPGVSWSFCVRAFDAAGNEERNEVVRTATPLQQVTITVDGAFGDWATVPVLHADGDDAADSSGPDWLDVRVANDATHLYVRFGSANAFNLDGSPAYAYSRMLVFLDTDADATTGYDVFGVLGSELLVAGADLFAEAPGVFNAGWLGALAAEPRTAITDCELAIPLAQVFAATPGATTIRLLFLNDEVTDFAPDTGSLTYTLVGF